MTERDKYSSMDRYPLFDAPCVLSASATAYPAVDDKTLEMCRSRFPLPVNFSGTPFIPQPDDVAT